MKQVMPDISVVICAYTEERWHELVAAVKAIQAQTVPAREIIVVIDHNWDLWQRVRDDIPGVIAVENKEQRGLSGARNSGIKVAQGEVIAFTDEDAIPAADWLAHLNQRYDDPRVLGVGGAIEPLWADRRPDWFPEEFDWVVGCTYRGMPQTTAPVRNLIGCNMTFRREVFEVIGGFRSGIGRIDTLPVGCEETELCIRLRQRQPDALLYYEPKARVHHRVPPGRARWRYFRSRCYHEGRSKAMVTSLAGSRDGLSTERAYTFRTLPRSVCRRVLETVRQRNKAELIRAGAIVVGLAITTIGYLAGRISIVVNRCRRRNSLEAKYEIA